MVSNNLSHYRDALQTFLDHSQGALTPATSSRVVKAREKLRKLTTIQFSDLGTDVYDEMERREKNRLHPDDPNAVKYLPSQAGYHPKRNQARQKLAALPLSRFKDLVNDVCFEITSRMDQSSANRDNGDDVPHKQKSSTSTESPTNNKNVNGLTIDMGKVNKAVRDPTPSSYSGSKTPVTPSQREIKPTTLIPQKTELTWSSDEDEEENENDNDNDIGDDTDKPVTVTTDEQEEELDVMHRSPSKRYTVATNEIFNEHAPADVKFPVDDEIVDMNNYVKETDGDMDVPEISELRSKIETIELENSRLRSIQNDHDELSKKYTALDKQLEGYSDYDELKREFMELNEKYTIQTSEFNALKEITEQGQEKQLSVEDSREFDTLKTYLDKVVEENEQLKDQIDQMKNQHNEATNLANEQLISEHERLKDEYEELQIAHQSLSKKNMLLENQLDDTKKEFSDYKARSKSELTAAATAAAVAAAASNAALSSQKAQATSATNVVTPTSESFEKSAPVSNSVLEWQNKFQALRADQLTFKFDSLNTLPDLRNDKGLFASNGLVSTSKIANVYSSLETILLYLDSVNFDSKNNSLVDSKKVDPQVLFQRVASYVSYANELASEINPTVNDKDKLRIEEQKRILKNSIANALSTTRHFALYRHILPRLVLNASLNDVYFTVCSLVSIARIRNDNFDVASPSPTTDTQQNHRYFEDHATISETPLALKTIPVVYSDDSPLKLKDEPITPATATAATTTAPDASAPATTRPLRITQRLASNTSTPVLANPSDMSKPGNANMSSRTGSPMMLGSSILPMIVASSENLSNMNPSKGDNSSESTIHIPKRSMNSSPTTHLGNNTVDGVDSSKRSISSLANKLSLQRNEKVVQNGNEERSLSRSSTTSKSSQSPTSPVRGRNIFDKMKKFDSSFEDVSQESIEYKSSPSKVRVGSNVAKAFDKFGAKRRSTDLSDDGVVSLPVSRDISTGTAPINEAITSTGNGTKDGDDDESSANDKFSTIKAVKNISPMAEYHDDVNDDNEVVFSRNVSNPFLALDSEISELPPVTKDTPVTLLNDVHRELTADKPVAMNQPETLDRSAVLTEPPMAMNQPVTLDKPTTETTSMTLDQAASVPTNNTATSTSDQPKALSKEVQDEVTADNSVSENQPVTLENEATSTLEQPRTVLKAVHDEVILNNTATSTQDQPRILSKDVQDEIISDNSGSEDQPVTLSKELLNERAVVENSPHSGEELTKVHLESVPVALSNPLTTSTQEEDDDDFNNYSGSTRAVGSSDPKLELPQSAQQVESKMTKVDMPLPSAGSALEIDEGLARRVSKRSIRRESRGIQQEQEHREGWRYDGEEDDGEDDEEFDFDNFNTLNPDNTLRELLLYLEHQTVEVIKAIQQTLQSIRDPKATKGMLRVGADEINSVVKQMAEGTSTLMNQSRYVESMGHAKYVVGVLEDCVKRMEGLYGNDKSADDSYAGKNFKQRSAGIAFDVARSTKELVKTVEEASLRDEIAVLDSRLRR